MLRSAMPMGLVALSVLAACSKDDSTDDTDIGTDECTVNVVSTFPENGKEGYYRGTVEVNFSGEDPTATMTVSSASGEVAGTSEWRNTKTLVFTPSAPLDPSTPYTVDIHFCGGDPQTTFTTSDVGAPVDSATLPGKVYSLDLSSGRVVHPEGVGDLLATYLTQQVLVSVDTVSNDKIKMIGAVAVEGSDPLAQDPCSRTIDFPEADFTENPYFEVGPKDTTLQISDYSVDVTNLFVSGSFSPDLSEIEGAVLSGSIDTRPLVPAFDPEGEDSAICDIAVSVGVSCEECGGENPGAYCLSVYIDSIQATLQPDTVVTPITELPAECEEPTE